ncbi:MAG: hypothetical protein ABR925_03490 [Acidimicrobiales bacterium]
MGRGAIEVTKVIEAEAPPQLAIEFVEQAEPRGTGDAVAVALTGFAGSYGAAEFDEDDVIVLPGDTPLLCRTTIGPGAVVGPSVHLVDCEVGRGAMLSHTVGSLAVIGERCVVGPYVVLEKGASLAPGERRGPFFADGLGGAS